MRCKSTFDFSFLALIVVALACVPAASATSINEDSSRDNTTVESIPVAVCGFGIPSHHRASADVFAEGTNTAIPECLGGTSGGMLADLLSILTQTGISGGMTNGIVTGILSGSSTGVVALGPFCGGSGSCFASASPVSTVPEPRTSVLLGLGLSAIAFLFHRRCLGRAFSFYRCS
jgi:hypothetical protein